MQTGGLILLSWCEYCILIEKSGTVYNVICGVKYFIKSQNIETNQLYEQNQCQILAYHVCETTLFETFF